MKNSANKLSVFLLAFLSACSVQKDKLLINTIASNNQCTHWDANYGLSIAVCRSGFMKEYRYFEDSSYNFDVYDDISLDSAPWHINKGVFYYMGEPMFKVYKFSDERIEALDLYLVKPDTLIFVKDKLQN